MSSARKRMDIISRITHIYECNRYPHRSSTTSLLPSFLLLLFLLLSRVLHPSYSHRWNRYLWNRLSRYGDNIGPQKKLHTVWWEEDDDDDDDGSQYTLRISLSPTTLNLGKIYTIMKMNNWNFINFASVLRSQIRKWGVWELNSFNRTR